MFNQKIILFLGLAAFLSACGGSGGESGVPSSDDPSGVETGNGTVTNPVSPPTTQGNTPPTNPGELPRADIRDLDSLYPYRANSPYANVLKECALASTSEEACTLQTLPFIVQDDPAFTREDVMNRLLVSHDWMGERFETLLNDAPSLMLPLFGSVTSISMGSEVRPSNYNSLRGAIRLDPYSHWLTLEEKANISIQSDFRSDFGAELKFDTINSLRINSRRVGSSATLTDFNERTLEQIKIPVYRLWFHELAHAVDFLPPESVPTLDSSLTPNRALYNNRQYYLSPRLYDDMPLYSDVLFGLGQVNYRGEEPDDLQKSYVAADVGAEMAIDGAMKFYAYSTIREDFATLFANAMLKLTFNVDHYTSFIDKPADPENFTCEDLIVGWGVKNRLADPLVSVRAKRVLEQVYGPSASLDQFFNSNVGQTIPMTAGLDWCANVVPVPTADSLFSARSSTAKADELMQLQYEAESTHRNIGH